MIEDHRNFTSTDVDNFPRNLNGLKDKDHLLPKAFFLGFDSFLQGKIDSPFHLESDEYKEWSRGFNAAWINNKHKISN